MCKNKLIDDIANVFKGVPKPRNVTMRVARAIDDNIDESEYGKLRELDCEVSWEEIPDNLIKKYDDILNFLEPEGFRYYIPRYMIWSINNYTSDSSVIGNVICFFQDCFDEWNYLNTAEKAVCIKFLQYFMNTEDTLNYHEEALESLEKLGEL